MNNAIIANALNGVAIAAANNGDLNAVSKLEQAAQIVASIVPASRLSVLPTNAYDATAASTTAFLAFSSLTTNVIGASGQSSPQFDSLGKTITQSGIAAASLGA